MMEGLISRQAAINAVENTDVELTAKEWDELTGAIMSVPFAEPGIIRCEDCKYWDRQTTYQGVPLSWGHCDSEHMWDSLYGEAYEVAYIETNENHYCGYAERRANG